MIYGLPHKTSGAIYDKTPPDSFVVILAGIKRPKSEMYALYKLSCKILPLCKF